MKKSKVFVFLGLAAFVATILFISSDIRKAQAEETRQKKKDVKVVAYYFHGDVRCPTCMKLEEYSGEAVNQGFVEETKKGALEFKAVNVDQDANSHFIKDYQLVSKALVLSRIENGKEVKWKNLDKIWTLVRDHDKYIEYVKDETKKMMEDKS